MVKKVGGLCTFSQTVSVFGTNGTFLWRFEFMNIAIGTSDHLYTVIVYAALEVTKWNPENHACTAVNLRALQYRCNALPAELTSQLGAGHSVGS